jgi:hypothetical protein
MGRREISNRHLAKKNCDSLAFLAFGKKKGQFEMVEALISVQKKTHCAWNCRQDKAQLQFRLRKES